MANVARALRASARKPQWTAQDFETALKYPETRHDRKLIEAALRIAARVMAPGVIENEIIVGRLETIGFEADAIRKALTNG